MRLGRDGLFLVERLEGLTGPLFEALMEDRQSFTLKVDYRDLPPPVEELDLVHLIPALPLALSSGTLVLRRVSDGFEFCRVAPGYLASREGAERVARVLRVERPGVLIRLDSAWWRLVGALLVRVPGFPWAFDRWRHLRSFVAKLLHPFPCPLSLGPPERLMKGVIEKHGHPEEVRYHSKCPLGELEAWEEELFTRVWPRSGRLLVVGCGAGREAIALAKRGFTVVGIDCVPGLIEAARRRAEAQGLAVTFEVRAADDLAYPAESFNAVLCAHGVYEQTPTRRRRIELLRAFGHLVKPEGCLLLCAGWYPDRGPRLALVDGLRWLLGRVLCERFPTEPGDRLIRHLSLASDARIQCFYHVFQGPAEIHQEIVAAGLIGVLDPEGAWIVRKPS